MEFTKEQAEIRRLHAVCRRKNAIIENMIRSVDEACAFVDTAEMPENTRQAIQRSLVFYGDMKREYNGE